MGSTRQHPDPVVAILEKAHADILTNWSPVGPGSPQRSACHCLVEAVVVANGQPATAYFRPAGAAKDALQLLADLFYGDGSQLALSYWYPEPGTNLGYWNDNHKTTLQDVSDLLVDAIAIARDEARP